MHSQPSEQEICKAVLDFATEGTYPEPENVVAAEFPLTALSKELELITQERDHVEAEINSLSRENDFDVDNWISQARQLHADLERSRLTAREIVKQHENTRPLELKVQDAAAVVELVEKEIVFNQAVTNALEEVQNLYEQLQATRKLCQDGKVAAAIETLEAVEHAIHQDIGFKNTNVRKVILQNVAALRQDLVESLHSRWSKHLGLDHKEGKLAVSRGALEETISALARLRELTAANEKFQKDLFLMVIDPILLPDKDGYSHEIWTNGSSIYVNPQPSPASVEAVLERITNVFNFLHRSLPASILTPLSDSFIPAVSSKIISHWLSSSIPTELDELSGFEALLQHIIEFTKSIESMDWHGQEELVSWVNQAPRLWLTRRRVHALDQVRKVLDASKGDSRQVERIEKRKVIMSDEVILDNSASDDWDAGWEDEKEELQNDEDEDTSAWGLDDDVDDSNDTKVEKTPGADDDDDGAEDAWGWGEDDDEHPPENTEPRKVVTAVESIKYSESAPENEPREITLKEHYTITDVPDSILRIIWKQVADSKAISQPVHSGTLVSSSGAGLLALPTLVLAMFKATASSFYSLKLNFGQMYLYNDSLYLAERVREVANENQLPRLHADVEALEKFGKLAYSKEMQTQRIIVTDLLDGAQGFSQCSEQPFLGECENAVSATVDRVRDVYAEWQPILSHSALLQAIGSLVSTVINKIILDIVDLGDISESQSQKLVSFCTQLSRLEELFLPENSDNVEPVPMTAVYVRNWLKFQYLVNILESSLADIKFLWVEGELSLEFSVDEVVDLIEALFAESEYRRKAIAEIKRVSRGR
ncbi:uncharacterized protein BJX67DRAFT_351755 [Aspergillus lucknowensis]|uniref:Retrograde transport protein Dsl1 C-terminal domain-containing protein n=1 Tax=Aspergillus lucknowensis TaxID=176173 RepID=A0ABR4LTT7_9EURO